MALSDKDGEQVVFGYGSLILPTSIVSRFVDLEESVDSIYENEITEGEELTLEEAEEAWEELKEDINVLPVKIPGFRRTYSFESPRGGTMLEAEHTGNEDDYINGIIVTGLTEDQVQDIDSTEESYDRVEIPSGEIEHYLDDDQLEEMGVELPETVEIYVEGDSEMFGQEVSSGRNETYHARILKGIEMLENLYGTDVAEEFMDNFLESTYEESAPGGFKISVEEKDSSLKAYMNLIEDLYAEDED